MPDFFAHPTAVIDPGCEIGDGTRIWHFSHVMGGAVLGENCNLGQNVFIGPDVQLGKGVKIQNNVSVYKGVSLGDDVFVGPSAVFTNVINPRSAVERKDQFMQTRVEQGASIGANATIICGNTLGAFCMIGAGAVVSKDIPDYALVVGNPARQIGWVSAHGHRLQFDAEGVAHCPETGKAYRLQDQKVTEE